MAAAPYGDLPVEPVLSRFASLFAQLRGELALRPHRLRSAIRSAIITALGAGLMAAAHVDSNLGPYVIWLLVGTPTAMLSWRTGVVFTTVAGVVLAVAVVLARLLAQSPVLMLANIGVLGAVSTYAIARFKLGVYGIVGQVIVFDSLYGVMFAPDQIGWAAAATFGGLAAGVALIVLFDNWFWPDPAEAMLVESLVDNLRRVRARIAQAARAYLAQHTAGAPHVLHSIHELSTNLTLLARARAEGISEHRRAVLVAAITRVARLNSIANELIIANDSLVPHNVRQAVAPQILAVIDATSAALDELCANPEAMLRSGFGQTSLPATVHLHAAIAVLDARVTEIRPAYLAFTGAPELSNFSAFLNCLREVCRLVERPLDEPSVTGPPAVATETRPDLAITHYCLKVAIGLVLSYVIGLTSQRADLTTIMTTAIITAMPTYGAAARKMILRLAGGIIGGAFVILMVIVVSPNFETVPVYVIAIFLTLVVSGYTGQSSERFAYAGKQIGTTVMLAYAGLSPSVAVEAPLWRVWGILLGTFAVFLVTLTLWPEYAADSLPSRLRQLLRLTLDLAPCAAAAVPAIRGLEAQLNGVIEQTLAVADDARLEGHASKLDPDAVVRTVGTIRRIAHRLEMISLARIVRARPELDTVTEDAIRVVLDSAVAQLRAWLGWIESPSSISSAPPGAQANLAAITQALATLNVRVEADRFAQLNGWEADQRRTLFTELESLRRLEVLIRDLDQFLAQLPAH